MDLFVSSGPLKRDRKWVTGRGVLSQVNQEAEAHGSKTASLASCFYRKTSAYISCLVICPIVGL